MAPAWLYRGEVMHQRLYPVRYRFTYPVFSVLLDIDRLDAVDRLSPLFSVNRANLLSFHEADHGPRDGSPLRAWAEHTLARAGVDLADGRIRLHAFPRLLGYVFNPLSVWYCEHADGTLRAVICQVHNTFGEQHCYLLHDGGRALDWPLEQQRSKVFHVSPFIGMQARYRFRLFAPGRRLRILIREYEAQGLMLYAAQTGSRQPFTTRHLAGALARTPLMTFKVMAAIHWQALKIWLRGGRFYPKPDTPPQELTP
ncbi:MAG: DUF1365 domain-containing protein [Gammaproteobacteria bacterium]